MRPLAVRIVVAAALFIAAGVFTFAQVEPAAVRPTHPLAVGVGVSENFLDFAQGSRMSGLYGWVDWRPLPSARFIGPIGLDLEVRDVNYLRPSQFPGLRLDTALAGVNVTVLHGERARLYGKFLAGLGSADFPPGYVFTSTAETTSITHRSMQIYALGEGVEWRLNGFLKLRVDEETQIWPRFFTYGSSLTPASISVGVSHTFGSGYRGERPAYYR